jgi:hypothetical protein
MDHFAGLDVSVKETSVCIVDEMGEIVREVKVASEPEALLAVLANPAYHFKRIGLEAGPDRRFWSNRCWLSDGSFASNSASCIAACWQSSGTTLWLTAPSSAGPGK